jgi:hypothetical protein
MEQEEIREIVRAAVEEFVKADAGRAGLEQRVNELVAENARAKAVAEEARKDASIRAELQRLGVTKIDLAFKAVKDDLKQDGVEMTEYLARFVAENPELLPARLAGGSGATGSSRASPGGGAVDLENIRPGMSPEEMERVRQEIARVAFETLRSV